MGNTGKKSIDKTGRTQHPELSPQEKQNKKILFTLFLGVLMGALDIAVVGPALNPIRETFNADSRSMTWIFTIYVLMNLIGTPIFSKFSDTIGRKQVYITAVVMFSAGSLVVIVAPDIGFVILGRAIQGFGAGGIFPVASAVIGDTFPPEKRGGALGLIGAVFGIAFIIGPVLGGLLLMADWHWIFIINLPIAVVLVILAVKNLPSSKKKSPCRFDLTGAILISLMLACFVYGINSIDTTDFFKSLAGVKVYPFLGAAIVLLALSVLTEKRACNPIVAPALFKSRQLRITHLLSFGAGFAEASLVFIPLLTVAAYGASSSVSSFMLMPAVIAMSIGSPSYGRLIDKIGPKPVILFGTAVMAAGMLLLGFFTKYPAMFYVSTFLIGVGLSGLLGAPIRYILIDEVDEEHRSSAQGVMTVFASSGQMICAAVIGSLISSFGGSVSAFGIAYIIIGVFSMLLLIVSLALKKGSTSKT
ncbi:MAG: MFS transporter [Clostridiales bacterium]|nr:MFS transporter [Clostridiales bacterium]